MDGDNFEVETGSRDELRCMEQEDPSVKDEGSLAAQEKLRTLGEEWVDGCSCHEQTVITTTGSRRQ